MVTKAQANRILDNLFGGQSLSPTDAFYIGLSTTTINSNGVGASEPSEAGYSRVRIANTKDNFTIASDGTLQNKLDIQFPESQQSWGNITDVFIADSLSGKPNILYYDKLTTPRTVEALTTLMFQAGTLKISLQ